jgi:hypothetical protein
VYVPAGLKLDRGADLLDRERCRDGYTELAGRDQARDLLDGAGGGVGAVCRGDSVEVCGDGGDALVRDAKFSCRLRRLGPVEVDGGGDAGGSQGAPRARRASADVADPVPITRAPARRASCTANTPTPPAAPPMSSVSPGPGLTTASAAAAVHPPMARVAAVKPGVHLALTR